MKTPPRGRGLSESRRLLGTLAAAREPETGKTKAEQRERRGFGGRPRWRCRGRSGLRERLVHEGERSKFRVRVAAEHLGLDRQRCKWRERGRASVRYNRWPDW